MAHTGDAHFLELIMLESDERFTHDFIFWPISSARRRIQ